MRGGVDVAAAGKEFPTYPNMLRKPLVKHSLASDALNASLGIYAVPLNSALNITWVKPVKFLTKESVSINAMLGTLWNLFLILSTSETKTIA